ncbi:MAG TPA: TPM domain-containing protein [Burkholderiales bacterium]
MDFARAARHLFALPGAVRRAFPAAAMTAIEDAIAASEKRHGGEIRFAVEPALDRPFSGQSARERALEVFSLLRLWDTAERNGVLIYLLLADREIEIVADRGVKAPAQEWEAICRAMESRLKRGEFAQAALDGVAAVSRLLEREFPPRTGDRNELPDRPVTL